MADPVALASTCPLIQPVAQRSEKHTVDPSMAVLRSSEHKMADNMNQVAVAPYQALPVVSAGTSGAKGPSIPVFECKDMAPEVRQQPPCAETERLPSWRSNISVRPSLLSSSPPPRRRRGRPL